MSLSFAFFGSMAIIAFGAVGFHFCKEMFGKQPMARRNKC